MKWNNILIALTIGAVVIAQPGLAHAGAGRRLQEAGKKDEKENRDITDRTGGNEKQGGGADKGGGGGGAEKSGGGGGAEKSGGGGKENSGGGGKDSGSKGDGK